MSSWIFKGMSEQPFFFLESHLNKIKVGELRCKLGFDSMFLDESDGKAGGLVLFYQKENKV